MSARTKSLAFAAVVIACGLSGTFAQEKIWKHGILDPNSDSGFITMVDKGGFAAERGLKVSCCESKPVPR